MRYAYRKKRYRLAAALADAAGPLLRPLFGARRAGPLRQPERILVARLDHLGDVLGATGLPKLLKAHFPTARIYFLTSTRTAPLLERNPFVDEVILYDAPWFWKPARAGGAARLIARLRRERISLALLPRGDVRENFIAALAQIPERVGYGITGGEFLLTRPVRWKEGAHESEHAAELLAPLGIAASRPEPRVYLGADEIEALRARRREWGIGLGEGLVGFQPKSGMASKDWPHERVRAFADGFARRFPDRRLLWIGERPHPEAPPGAVDLGGRTSLRQLCALMPLLDAFIGPDSGPTHLAAASGVPTVFLFSGQNEYGRWKPRAERARTLRREVPCAPCGLRRCTVAGHPCMAGIDPAEALEALASVMRERA